MHAYAKESYRAGRDRSLVPDGESSRGKAGKRRTDRGKKAAGSGPLHRPPGPSRVPSRQLCRRIKERPRPRRGGRVVDGSGLENRHSRKAIGGSNPSLSARIPGCFCLNEVLPLRVRISPAGSDARMPAQVRIPPSPPEFCPLQVRGTGLPAHRHRRIDLHVDLTTAASPPASALL